jgi:hypothetical protein
MSKSQYYITTQMLRVVGMPENMIPYARPGMNYDPYGVHAVWQWMVQDGLTTVFDKMAMPHKPWKPERKGIDFDAINGFVSCEVSNDLSGVTAENLRASGWPEALVQSMVENAKGSDVLAAYEEKFLARRAMGKSDPQPA